MVMVHMHMNTGPLHIGSLAVDLVLMVLDIVKVDVIFE